MTSPDTRIEKDALGNVPVPATACGARRRSAPSTTFRSASRASRWGRPVIRAFGLVKHCAARANAELGRAAPRQGRADRAGRAGSDRRPLGRRVSAGRVPDRLGHAVEHERERGDRQSRDPARRRRRRIEEAGASQRRRQPQPVVERCLSRGHARRNASRSSTASCCRRLRNCAPRSTARRANSPTS